MLKTSQKNHIVSFVLVERLLSISTFAELRRMFANSWFVIS